MFVYNKRILTCETSDAYTHTNIIQLRLSNSQEKHKSFHASADVHVIFSFPSLLFSSFTTFIFSVIKDIVVVVLRSFLCYIFL